MATLFIRHDVSDFDSWKQEYDAFDAERQTMGVVDQGVYQADGNPNDVTVYHEFRAMDEAKAFVGDERLREAMGRAGVEGEPDVWLTEKA